MVASNMTVGVDLLTTPPLGLNRVLIYAARLSRLDTVWAVDHWQGPIPTAIWDQQFSWYATQYKNPHELFDYQVLLGYLAKSAGRLRIGVGVTDPIRRHPVLIAQAMLTLAHAVMDLRAPKGKTPEIWIGGQGPRMLQLTGQYEDGWYPTAIASQEEYAAKLQVIQNTAQEAGRDPQAITPALVQNFVVAPTEQEARKMLDTRFGRLFALQVASAAWSKVGAQHPFGEHFRGFIDWIPEQYERKMLEEALAAVPPEVLGYGLLWGTPEQVAGKLRAYGEVGVRHVVLVPISAIVSRRASIYGLWAIRKIARWLRKPG